MKLSTQRLILVPLGPKFLTSTHRYSSDPDNAQYMVHLPNTTLQETESFLQSVQAEWEKSYPEFYEFAILLDDEHIGAVSISLDQERSEGELGWIIRKDHWGKGYALEAAREVMRYSIQNLHIRRFLAHCDSENRSSYRVIEKLGMTLAGRTPGRRNKFSEEDREDLMYLIKIE